VPDRPGPWFALLVVCCAAFVWRTSASLPLVVASHFGASGAANGSMSRDLYVRFMLAIVIGAPVLLVVVSHLATGGSGARINLPNRDYWLAPERREQTISYLRTHLTRFSAVLAVFLCYVHWLLVRANQVQPAQLSNRAMWAGLGALLVFALIWTRRLVRRFSNRGRGG
jgi:uncharacterized membrane protein